jgi:hypothetical protein
LDNDALWPIREIMCESSWGDVTGAEPEPSLGRRPMPLFPGARERSSPATNSTS